MISLSLNVKLVVSDFLNFFILGLLRGVRCCTAWLPAPFCGIANRTTKALLSH